jgi:hypothetical protein
MAITLQDGGFLERFELSHHGAAQVVRAFRAMRLSLQRKSGPQSCNHCRKEK